MSAAERARWRDFFTERLAQTGAAPDKVRVRAGQGLHVLCSVQGEPDLDVVLAPAADGHAALARTALTSLRYVGSDDLPEQRARWVETIRASLPTCEADPGWPALLASAADAKGISVAAQRADLAITSGDELVIRLLEPCNARCDFCACIGVMRDAAYEPDLALQQLQEGFDAGYRNVSFTGGEPTLLPDLADRVAQARAIGFERINVQTNGVRLADEALPQRLAQAGLDQVLLSLHSHRAEVHDAVLKLPGAFEAATQGIDHCIAAGIRVRLNFVLHAGNLADVVDFMVYVYKRFDRALTRSWHGHLGVTLSFVSPIGWTLEHLEMIPRISDAAPHIAKALDVAEAVGLDVHIPGLCGIPICTMPGYENFLEEYRGSGVPRLDTRTYVPACADCRFRERCSGYWSKYLELYGEGELGPDAVRPWARGPAGEVPAPLMSAMVQLATRGTTAFAIADTLNRKKLRTPRGGRWTDMVVRDVLAEQGVQVSMDAPGAEGEGRRPQG